MRDEAQVQGHDGAAEQLGEVGDLLHLLRPRRPHVARDEADGPRDGRDIRIAFPFEPAKNGGQRDAQVPQLGHELRGILRRARGCRRRVQLDGRHLQGLGDFEFHPQSRVDTGKYPDRPLVHDWRLLVCDGVPYWC